MTNEQSSFTIRNSRVVILGLARQGTALARFLALAGAEVTVSDLQDEAALADYLAELADLPIRYVLGEHPLSLLDEADLLCLSGGVPVDVPIVVEAQRRGILLSNDAQIFLEQCPASVIGITGSAGKTTTTALVGEMCRAAGLRTWVGGNIGNPLIADLDQIRPGDWVVMELSSFQLEVMTVSPHIAAVLNVTPNHLDRHKTMEAYIAAKRNIVAHQRPEEFALLGYDDANARALALETAAHLLWFSGGAEVDEGAFRTNGELTLRLGDAPSPRRPATASTRGGEIVEGSCPEPVEGQCGSCDLPGLGGAIAGTSQFAERAGGVCTGRAGRCAGGGDATGRHYFHRG